MSAAVPAPVQVDTALTDLAGDVTTPTTVLSEQSVAKRQRTSSALRAPDTNTSTSHVDLFSAPLSIIVFGATGDLAKKKLFPALYKLCLEEQVPRDVNIVGYGRSAVELSSFIAKQCVNVRDDPAHPRTDFLERISFHAGGYDASSSYEELDCKLRAYERAHPSGAPGNRLFFLSVPPTVFGTVAEMISLHCRASAGGFTRLMIEKPFGRDSASFEELNALTAAHFEETQLYRIDHYLGKEIILNISTLRWANALFEPMWTAKHVESVQIVFKENIGTEGRGGYFDEFGIIRDLLQNHLLQAFMFLAMEPPEAMTAAAILAAKVELLRTVRTLDLHEGKRVFLGQFKASTDGTSKGYLEDVTVPAGSRCPTFAACVLTVDNARWRGVPFLLSAGKGLDERLCELRVRFRPMACNQQLFGAPAQNELVMRVQPDEALYVVASSKQPGISAGLASSEERRTPVAMGLRYAQTFGDGGPFVCG
jgi:glucose-6-phosphate 1-dehydrogenase